MLKRQFALGQRVKRMVFMDYRNQGFSQYQMMFQLRRQLAVAHHPQIQFSFQQRFDLLFAVELFDADIHVRIRQAKPMQRT